MGSDNGKMSKAFLIKGAFCILQISFLALPVPKLWVKAAKFKIYTYTVQLISTLIE